jgi:hypothetical protein
MDQRGQRIAVNYCWSSPAKSTLFSGMVGTDDHIFVLSRLLRVLKWCLFFDEMRGVIAIGHSFSIVGVPMVQKLCKYFVIYG